MARNPFEALMTRQAENTKVTNPYDDGSIWSAPVDEPAQVTSGFYQGKGATNHFLSQNPVQDTIEDPLEYPRGQINYYTQKYNDAGMQLPSPDALDRKESVGSKVFNKAMDFLQVTGTPINLVAGMIDETIKSFDDDDKDSVVKNIGDVIMAGLKSGASTLLAPLNSDLREHRRDLSTVFESARESDNAVINTLSRGFDTLTPVYAFARLMGKNDDDSRAIAGTVSGMVLDMAISAKLDIDGIGKALKVINRGDEIAKITQYTTGDEALRLAKKVIPEMNNDDIVKAAQKITGLTEGEAFDAAVDTLKKGYGKEAQSLVTSANKKLGGLGEDYKGITMGNKTLLSVEQLQKIGSTKKGKILANVVGGYASPVGLAWSGLSGRTAEQLSKGNIFYKGFGGDMKQGNLANAYDALQRGDTETIMKSIYSAKQAKKIYNLKNTADTMTHKKATELQELLKLKGVDTNAVAEAIELYGSKETWKEITATAKMNPKYLVAAAEGRAKELKALQKELTEKQRNLEALDPESLKKELEAIKERINLVDSVGADEVGKTEQLVNEQIVDKPFALDNPVAPTDIDTSFARKYEKIINSPMDTPEQRSKVINRIKKLVKNHEQYNPKMVEDTLDNTPLDTTSATKVNFDNWETDTSQLDNAMISPYGKLDMDSAVPNKSFNGVDTTSLTKPNFDGWETDLSDIEQQNIKIGTLQNIAEKNKEFLPQPRDVSSPEEHIKSLNELRRTDGRKFYKITEEEYSKIIDEYEKLGVNISEDQLEKFLDLSRYEGQFTHEIVDDIAEEFKNIEAKKKYRAISHNMARRDLDRTDEIVLASKGMKLFTDDGSGDFNKYNAAYGILNKALAFKKMAEKKNPRLAEFVSKAYMERVAEGVTQNKYTKDQLEKLYDNFLNAWDEKMPRAKWRWLRKNKDRVIESWKYLDNSDLYHLERHHTMFNLKPPKKINTNKNIVGRMVADYEDEVAELTNTASKVSDAQKSNAYLRQIDEADLYKVKQEHRDQWLAETQEDTNLNFYMGTNREDYWDKSAYFEDVKVAKKDGNMRVYNAETGEMELSKKEKAYKKYINISKETEANRRANKPTTIAKEDEWMAKVGDDIRQSKKLERQVLGTNRGLFLKGRQILDKFLAENNITSIPKTVKNEIIMYQKLDDINNNLSKIMYGSDSLSRKFAESGQDAVYREVAEFLGKDYDQFMKLESKADLDRFNRDLMEFIRRQADLGNDEYAKYAKKNLRGNKQALFNGDGKEITTARERASILADIFDLDEDELLDEGFLDSDYYDSVDMAESFVKESVEDKNIDDVVEKAISKPKPKSSEDVSVEPEVEAYMDKFRRENPDWGNKPIPANEIYKPYTPKNEEVSEFTANYRKMKAEWEEANAKPNTAKVEPYKQGSSAYKTYEEVNPLAKAARKGAEPIPAKEVKKYNRLPVLDEVKARELKLKSYDELNPIEKKLRKDVIKKSAKDSVDEIVTAPITIADKTKARLKMIPEEINEMVEDIKTLDPAERAKAIKENEDNYLRNLIEERAKIQKAYNYQGVLHDKYLANGEGTKYMEVNAQLASSEKKLKEVNEKIDDLLSFENSVGMKEIRLNQVQEVYKMLDEVEGDYSAASTKIQDFIKQTTSNEDLATWFQSKNPDIDISKMKYFNEVVEHLGYADTMEVLTDNEKKVAEFLRDAYKDMADAEGLAPMNEVREFFGYLPHMMSTEFDKDPKAIELSKKLGFNINDPFSINHMERKMKGTILELNRVIEAKYGVENFFETNLLRQFVSRSLHSNNYVAKDRMTKVFKNFERPIITAKAFRDLEFEEMRHELERLGIDVEYPDYEMSPGMRDDNMMTGLDNDIPMSGGYKSRGDILEPSVYVDKADHNYAEHKIGVEYPKEKPRAMIKKAYTERYYEFINNVRRGKHERYVMVRTETEEVSTVHKVIKASALEEASPEDLSRYGEQEALKNVATSGTSLDDEVKNTNAVYQDLKARGVEQKEANSMNINEIKKQDAVDLSQYQSKEDIIADVIAEGTVGERPIYKLFKDDVADLTVDQIVEQGYVLMDRHMAEQFNSVMDNMTRRKAGRFNTFYNKVMNVFKAWAVTSPGFHINNVVGNTFNSVIQTGMDVFSPAVQKDAYNLLQDLKKAEFDFDSLTGEIHGVSRAELARELVGNGVLSTFFNTDVAAVQKMVDGTTEAIENQSALKKAFGAFNPLDINNNVILNKNREIGEFLEQQGKIANIVAHLKQGRDMYTAIDLAQEALFDYSELTLFESEVIKQFIAPFYTFAKKNFNYQAENMANNPAVYTFIERLYRYVDQNFTSEKERMTRPDYISGGLKIADGKYVQLDTPLHSFLKILEPDGMLGMVNPMFKTAMDMAYNTKSYSGNPISKYNDPAEIAQYGLEGLFPFLQTGATVSGLFSGDSAKQEKAMRWLGGNRLKVYDQENAERTVMYEYLEELQNTWYKTIEKNPELKDLAEQVANSRNSGGTKSNNKNPFAQLLGR